MNRIFSKSVYDAAAVSVFADHIGGICIAIDLNAKLLRLICHRQSTIVALHLEGEGIYIKFCLNAVLFPDTVPIAVDPSGLLKHLLCFFCLSVLKGLHGGP